MGENYFGITDKGRQRKNNEDSFIAQPVSGNNFIAACVIDGVGGYTGGEVAARLTRDEILKSLQKLPANITSHMSAALEKANKRIIREKEVRKEYDKMACVVTLAVVDIEQNIFYFAHVGDTRLYLFRDGSLIKITKDHSTVGFLEESGRLTEEAAMLHPKRNEVNKALGYEAQAVLPADFIDTGDSPFLPGDTVLLCSDGLTDMIPSGKIISILNTGEDLKEKGRLLLNAANEAGGRDNITVVLVANNKSPIQHPATKPMVTLKKPSANANGETKASPEATRLPSITSPITSAKRSNRFLLILCFLFFLVILWLLFSQYKKNTTVSKLSPGVVERARNQDELNFLDSINAGSNAVVNMAGTKPLIITQAILVNNDSLHIKGNGISFISDSAYTGPAFILSASCKYILFDSLALENFNVGMRVLGRGLHLKQVMFRNCLVPLQFQQQLSPSAMLSGRQADTLFYYADSSHK